MCDLQSRKVHPSAGLTVRAASGLVAFPLGESFVRKLEVNACDHHLDHKRGALPVSMQLLIVD
jgi:hypothetical protein